MKNLELKEQLWAVVDKNKDDLINLVSDLIKIPSENPTGDMEEVTEYITKFFNENNIDNKVIRFKQEFPTIFAKFGNDDGKTFLFNGHSDVVPAGDRDKWNFDPFSGEITEDQILGRGTSDMKAGLAGAMFATKILSTGNYKMKGKVVFHVVSDEESGGDYGTKMLMDNGYGDNVDYCLVAEPTSYSNCEVGQKGSLWIKFKSHGKSAHGSIGNYVGENAILKLMKLLSRLEELRTITGIYNERQLAVVKDSKFIAREALKAPGVDNVIDHVTVNIGTISGGVKSNMVADYCESEVDMRLPLGVKASFIEEKIKIMMTELGIEGIEYDLKWNSEANFTDVDEQIVKSVVENGEKVWGKRVIPAYQWASSDARYYRNKNIPTIQYGPANTEGIHSYNECVDIEDVINSTKVYLGMLADILEVE